MKNRKEHYWITLAINELGPSFRYSNFTLWCRINNINIDKAIRWVRELIKERLIEVKLEVRCPLCGALLGIYNKYDEIPEYIECGDCGRRLDRDDIYRNMEILFTLTQKGRTFFRTEKRKRKVQSKRTIETYLSTVFDRKRP